jgi:transposase
MSLRSRLESHVPEETARVARAAFPKGSPCLTLRDELERIYADSFIVAMNLARFVAWVHGVPRSPTRTSTLPRR